MTATPTVRTHCPYCALQCGMTLTPTPDAALPLEVQPRNFPTNAGGLCHKGWTSASVLSAPGRMTTPMVREGGQLREASWEEAYDRIVAGVQKAQAERGADAVAVFGGGGLTNEKAYSLGKFARVGLGTSRIDYNGRFCMSSAAAAGGRSFGMDRGLPFPLTDLDGADAVVLVGSNPAETMPPFMQHLTSARERGGLVVIDPRRTATAALTEDGAGQHLQPLPGTDVTVLLGLLHLTITGGGVDHEYIAQRVNGWDAVARTAMMWWPEAVERATGVPVEELRSAARLLKNSSPASGGHGAYILTGRGAEQHAHGTDTVSAAINLALALGLPGRTGSGYGCLTGQGNGQGGREHGQKCDQLPGYRKITDPQARAHVAAVWGVDVEEIPGAGLPAVQLFDSLGQADGSSVLFVHGANPAVSVPDASRVIDRLASLDLLVVADFLMSETAAMADVVLPTLQWAQEEGTMTNLEGRLIRRRRALAPPEGAGARDELRIWRDLAQRLGSRANFSDDPREVFEELARASEGGLSDYSGLSYDLIDQADEDGKDSGAREGLHWPAPRSDDAEIGVLGTPRLFLDRFETEDGRAQMFDVRPSAVADDLRPDAPLYLMTGRVLQHYQSGAQTRRVAELMTAEPRAFVQLHPLTAEVFDIEEGQDVRIRTARGHATAVARLSNDIRRDCLFLPFHFAGEGTANRLTNPAVDPVSSMPEFKVCAASIEPAHSAQVASPRAAQPAEVAV